MDRLYRLVTNTTKTNKDQLNEAIYNEPTFYISGFNSSRGTRDPLPVVTATLQGGKKHRATTVVALIFLWDSRATDSMIKINTLNAMNARCGIIK